MVAFGLGMMLFLVRLVDVVASRLSRWALGTESKYDDLLVPFASKSAKVVIIVTSVMMILHNLDFNLTGAIATLGIGGLAFALAATDTISNLFGSLTVIADRPFQIGDWIVVDGHEGIVESLGFRSTRIRTFYNSLITVPNSTLINAAVDNYGARQFRRYRTVLSVTYGTPPERMEAFCEAIRQVIRDSPYTRTETFHIYFGASSLDILVYMFFQVPDWATELRERHRFNLDILRAAKRLGVEFAFPTQTLYLARGAGGAQPSDEPFMAREQIEAELARGRRVGAEIVRTTTGPRGHRPPPVTEPPSLQGGESSDGGGDA